MLLKTAFSCTLFKNVTQMNKLNAIRAFSFAPPPLDKYVQVLPIIKLSPNYPNGKILLGKWNYGNYQGRYTGLIEKMPVDPNEPQDQFRSTLEKFAQKLVPAEIRGYVTDVECKGILKFDGPPDSLEYICVANVKSLIDIKTVTFNKDYPYNLEWFDVNRIPFDKMPADDEIWYPLIMQQKYIKGFFNFGGLEARSIKSYHIVEVTDLQL